MIEIREVAKSYGASRVLDGVSLVVEPGEVVVLLGANGAGKSTLFRCVLGLTPYRGTIRVDGLDPMRNGREVRRRIGYMPQQHGLHPDLTVAATLEFYGLLRGAGTGETDRLLAEARLEAESDARVDELSGGMRQRLTFALAQLGDPPFLLLDEPTASLDTASRDHLVRRIDELAAAGKSILISTHVEPTLRTSHRRSVLLRDGRLRQNPSELREAALQRGAPEAFGNSLLVGWTVDSCGNARGGGRC